MGVGHSMGGFNDFVPVPALEYTKCFLRFIRTYIANNITFNKLVS